MVDATRQAAKRARHPRSLTCVLRLASSPAAPTKERGARRAQARGAQPLGAASRDAPEGDPGVAPCDGCHLFNAFELLMFNCFERA